MRAVILAAGRGSRLGPLSDARPKPLLPLAGIPLLTRLLTSLTAAGCAPVTLVTGYRADMLAAHTPACRTVHNPRWQRTSIAASLLAAADAGALDHGAIVTYGDIVAEPAVFTALLAAPEADVCLPVNTAWLGLWQARMDQPLDDAERLLTTPEGRLLDIGGTPTDLDEVRAQFMGILRLTAAGAADLTGFYRRALQRDAGAARWDTTALLAAWLKAGGRAAIVPVEGGWLEIDTPDDLAVYEDLHARGELKNLCDLNTTTPGHEGAVLDV
ncbi:phosphocholine cytidylyltransferase family protein [Streptomyces cellulosae]